MSRLCLNYIIRLPYGVFSRGQAQGSPARSEAVVIGNSGNRDNRRKRPSERKLKRGSLHPHEARLRICPKATACTVTEVIEVISNWLPDRFALTKFDVRAEPLLEGVDL